MSNCHLFLRLGVPLLLAMTAMLTLTGCTVTYLPSTHPRAAVVTVATDTSPCVDGKIGVTVDENLYVIGLATGGPAWHSGIRHGDIVVAVDGQRVFTIAQAQFHAAGPPGTLAGVTVRRPGELRLRTYTMLRACLP